jgi:hypothetical protein
VVLGPDEAVGVRALPRDVQVNVVSFFVLHADYLRAGKLIRPN